MEFILAKSLKITQGNFILSKAMEWLSILMELFMKDNGAIINIMAEGNYIMLKVILTRVNLKMIWHKDLGYITMPMEASI